MNYISYMQNPSEPIINSELKTTPDKDLSSWYTLNRTNILKNNIIHQGYSDELAHDLIQDALDKLSNTRIYTANEDDYNTKFPKTSLGISFRDRNEIYLKNTKKDISDTEYHELAHITNFGNLQGEKIRLILGQYEEGEDPKGPVYRSSDTKRSGYFDKPDEVHSRIFEVRRVGQDIFGFDQDHVYTEEDINKIEEYLKKNTDNEGLLYTLKNLVQRYPIETNIRLLNEIASNTSNNTSQTTQYAKYGSKLSYINYINK